MSEAKLTHELTSDSTLVDQIAFVLDRNIFTVEEVLSLVEELLLRLARQGKRDPNGLNLDWANTNANNFKNQVNSCLLEWGLPVLSLTIPENTTTWERASLTALAKAVKSALQNADVDEQLKVQYAQKLLKQDALAFEDMRDGNFWGRLPTLKGIHQTAPHLLTMYCAKTYRLNNRLKRPIAVLFWCPKPASIVGLNVLEASKEAPAVKNFETWLENNSGIKDRIVYVHNLVHGFCQGNIEDNPKIVTQAAADVGTFFDKVLQQKFAASDFTILIMSGDISCEISEMTEDGKDEDVNVLLLHQWVQRELKKCDNLKGCRMVLAPHPSYMFRKKLTYEPSFFYDFGLRHRVTTDEARITATSYLNANPLFLTTLN